MPKIKFNLTTSGVLVVWLSFVYFKTGVAVPFSVTRSNIWAFMGLTSLAEYCYTCSKEKQIPIFFFDTTFQGFPQGEHRLTVDVISIYRVDPPPKVKRCCFGDQPRGEGQDGGIHPVQISHPGDCRQSR